MKWYQWKETGENNRISKVMYVSTINDDIDVLKKLLLKFLFHCYIKDKQIDYYAKLKDYIKQDPTRDLVQTNFAENYTIAYQDEVQSVH